ncbi:hypothetical protein ACXWR7_11025, partial [Streptococcus pyogenes]
VWKWIYDPLSGILNSVFPSSPLLSPPLLFLFSPPFSFFSLLSLFFPPSFFPPLLLSLSSLFPLSPSFLSSSLFSFSPSFPFFFPLPF